VQAAPARLELDEWMPVIRKLVMLAAAVAASYGTSSLEASVRGELQATESAATEGIRADEIVDTTYEVLQSYVVREAACDTALEMYGGPDDFEKVVAECHSQGELQ